MRNSSSDACLPIGDGGSEVRWIVKVGGGTVEWDWATGPPEARSLEPIRKPGSGAKSRHIPVRAFCMTTRAHITLESGLEHDLLRILDRDRRTVWIAAQPCRLEWTDDEVGSVTHVPDLLSIDAEGRVTLWDVKPDHAVAGGEFVALADATAAASAEVGWTHEVFTGMSDVRRHNLMWLHGYRHRPEWADRWEDQLLERAASSSTLGDLLRESREQAAVVWHLIWNGRLLVDLTTRLGPYSEVVTCPK